MAAVSSLRTTWAGFRGQTRRYLSIDLPREPQSLFRLLPAWYLGFARMAENPCELREIFCFLSAARPPHSPIPISFGRADLTFMLILRLESAPGGGFEAPDEQIRRETVQLAGLGELARRPPCSVSCLWLR